MKEFKINAVHSVQEAVNEVENLEVNSVEALLTEVKEEGNRQLKNITEHLIECIAELDKRADAGKNTTLLQKNVFLNLLQQYDNIERRLDFIDNHIGTVEYLRKSQLYKVLRNENGEE